MTCVENWGDEKMSYDAEKHENSLKNETIYTGKCFCTPTRVVFNEDEESMIRLMAHKFGYPREEIVRNAVRNMYAYTIIGGGFGGGL